MKPIQHMMTHFNGKDNQLTSFPIQPMMIYFSGKGNPLVSFETQPKIGRSWYMSKYQLIIF